jgi:hypothetical protein
MTPATRRKALDFISTHVGARRKAFPFGYRFDFTDPDTSTRRVPFRIGTLYQLIEDGYVSRSGPVCLTKLGEAYLRSAK